MEGGAAKDLALWWDHARSDGTGLTDMDENIVIETSGLTKSYGKILAVDHISFEVKRGEIFGFLGPNGAGKTTTIRMLAGLSRPTEGSARVLGFSIESEIAQAKKHIGVVPELSNLYDELSAFDNLLFAAQLYGVPRRHRRERADKLLKMFGLYERRNQSFGTLSRGMKRALTIAAALVHSPELLFLDEPTVGLDVVAARSLRSLISSLRQQGTTIFLTTHYLEEADLLCDRIALIVKGRIVQTDSPNRLKARVEENPATEISFTDAAPSLVEDLLQMLPGLQMTALDHRVRIYGGAVADVLEAVIQLAKKKGIGIESVTSLRPSLEDAFVKITGLAPAVMAMEKGGRR